MLARGAHIAGRTTMLLRATSICWWSRPIGALGRVSLPVAEERLGTRGELGGREHLAFHPRPQILGGAQRCVVGVIVRGEHLAQRSEG